MELFGIEICCKGKKMNCNIIPIFIKKSNVQHGFQHEFRSVSIAENPWEKLRWVLEVIPACLKDGLLVGINQCRCPNFDDFNPFGFWT